MKKVLKYFAILMLSGVIFTACKDDETLGPGNIKILFPVPELDIDLNVLNNPPVISVINSENDLKQVEFYILKNDAVEKYGNTVTSFFNPKSYSINESLVYTGDMTGARVVAIDAGGNVKEAELPFNVKQVVGAPEIVFSPESIEMNEGDPVPAFSISITAHSALQKITFYKVVRGIQTQADDPLENFGGLQDYEITNEDLDVDNIFIPGITSFKIEVEDEYGKVKIASLPVTYHELPAPVVTFDQTSVEVNEFEPLTISGTITSYSDLTTATFKLRGVGSEEDMIIETKDFDPGSTEETFNCTIPSISSNYDAFVVEVNDILQKNTVSVKDITVIPAPSPEIALPQKNYYGIEKDSQISLSDNTITSKVSDLQNVIITTTTLNGTETEIDNIDNINQPSYTPNHSITATPDLAKISITATNKNGKTTTVEIPVTVGFWLLDDVRMQEQLTSKVNTDYTQLCVFSSVEKRALSLQEAFSMQGACDFTFYISSTPQIRVCSPAVGTLAAGSSGASSGKYGNETYGFDKWTTKNPTKISLIKHSSIAERDEFFNTLTADDIKALTQDSPSYTSHKSIEKTFLELVLFETVDRDGKKQRGVVRVDGIVGNNGIVDPNLLLTTTSVVKMSIILTTPY